ncbi:MAG: restriction endonuclease subunit S [Planctomycetes bacterium]|nr:restriction endonuclease subunit S [Planctomycetota bacterium]
MGEIKELPKGWERVALDDVAEIIMGQSPSSETYNSEGIGLPFFQGKAEFTELHPVVEKWCSVPNKIAETEDVLISVRAPVGATNIANQKCCIGRGLAAVRYRHSHKFFFYFLRLIEKTLDEQGTGTTFRAISGDVIRNTEISLPPLPEQRRIVAKIEELFSDLDKGVESLKTAQQQLKVYRQAVLKWAFEGRLVTPEKELEKCRLGEYSELITKGASPRWQGYNYVDDESQLLFVTSENVRENYLDISEPKFLSLDFNNIQKRSILKNGDVLFNLVGASIGRAAVFNLNRMANINQAVAVIRLKGSVSNKYLSYFLNSEVAKQKYLEKIVDVARANVSLTDVANIEIPLPSLVGQHRIVSEIEDRLSVCDKLEESISQSLQQADALRQSILKKAFEGKLVPQNPEDEPASALLEMIKAERAVQKKEPRGKVKA